MALVTAKDTGDRSAAIWYPHIGTTTISNATVATITLAGLTTNTFTATDLVNPIRGVWICISTLPTNGGNIVVTLQDNGVDTTATTYASASQLRLGWNFFWFATPYTPVSLAAGRYRFKVNNSVGSSGQVRVSAGSAPGYTAVYGTAATHGSTDDLWTGGPITDGAITSIDVTGDTGTFGSGTDTAIAASSNVSTSLGLALTVGNGARFKMKKTASSTVTMRGSACAYGGGVLDLSSDTADMSIVTTFKIDNNTSAGQFGILLPPNGFGDIISDGVDTDVYAIVTAGNGATGTELELDRDVDWDVGYELAFGTINGYTQQEKRFIRTKISARKFTLSSTSGGAESALTYSHTGAHVSNLTKNSIITAENTARGWFMYLQGSTSASDMPNTRFEYLSNLSGKGIISTLPSATVFDKTVVYLGGGNTRGYISFQGATTGTATGIVTYGTVATNQGNGAIQTQGSTNIRLQDCFGYGDGGTTGGCHFAFISNSANIVCDNCWSYGANSAAVATCAAVFISSSSKIRWANGGVNASRLYGFTFSAAAAIRLVNSVIGYLSANGTSDIFTVSSTYNPDCVAENCDFSSTPISNYLNQIDGSEFRISKFNGVDYKHYWYDIGGYGEYTGPGLSDTTVRTAGGYNIKLNPQNAVRGMIYEQRGKAVSGQIPFLKSWLKKNTALTGAPVKVELFLPGTDTTGTADDIFNAENQASSYQDYLLGTAYSGVENSEVLFRWTITASSGALYIADHYDSQESLNSAFEGKPSELIVPTDFSSVPGLNANYPDVSTTAGTMGRRWVDTGNNAELTQAKVDQL